MNARNDLERQLADFLQEGVTELPDRALDAIRAGTNQTRQRVVIGPWREPRMSNLPRLLAAVAVLAGLAVLGAVAWGGRPAPPLPSAPPTAGPKTPAAPTPTDATSLVYNWPGDLKAGTYSTAFTWDLPFEIRFTVPPGWASRDIEVARDPLIQLAFALVGNVSADPCAATLLDPPVGETVADLAAAIQTIPGLHVTAPRTVSVAGHDGLALDASLDSAVRCTPADFLLWVDPAGSHLPIGPFGPPTFGAEQPNMTISIIDVDGVRLVITQLWALVATPEDRAELQAVFDSIELGPPTQSMRVGACSLVVTHLGTEVTPPITLTLGPDVPDGLNGPAPDLSDMAPLAWIDWRGEGWVGLGRGGLGGTRLIPPPGTAKTGFLTRTMVNGVQGSFVFDAPGTWWVRISDSRQESGGCLRQFPVLVAAPAT